MPSKHLPHFGNCFNVCIFSHINLNNAWISFNAIKLIIFGEILVTIIKEISHCMFLPGLLFRYFMPMSQCDIVV